MSVEIRSSEHYQLKQSSTLIQKVQPNRALPPANKKRPSANDQIKYSKKKIAINYFQSLDLKMLIKQLKDQSGIQRNKLLMLIEACQNLLKYEPNVLRVSTPVMIVGDIHGQFYDLLNIFQKNGFPQKFKYLFLGDYVDRGLFCIQVITLLMVLKVKYPENVLLLRGNHEGRVMTMNFNFRLECQKKYGNDIYERFLEMFCKLPLCAIVDHTYFAVHGGISPEISTIKQIEKINRFVEISNTGVVCDLVWSDPSQDMRMLDWEPNKLRGCSYYYGTDQVRNFLKTNKIKMIVRGHQVQIEGYNYQKTQNEQKLTLTIFSAPNYCDVYKNKGAIAILKDNKFSIHKFGQVEHPFVLSNYMNILEFAMPGVCQLVGKLLVYLLRNRRKTKKQAALIDDKLLEQLNALKRIQQINETIQKKLFENEFVLFEAKQKQQQGQQQQQQQGLTTTKQGQMIGQFKCISDEAFMQKKVNDEQQMYPHEQVLQNIRERKNTKKMTIIFNKTREKIQQGKVWENTEGERENGKMEGGGGKKIGGGFKDSKEVFGPKLMMKNNIRKKTAKHDEEDDQTLGEDL